MLLYLSEVEGVTFKLGVLLRTLGSFWVPTSYMDLKLGNYQNQLISTFFFGAETEIKTSQGIP